MIHIRVPGEPGNEANVQPVHVHENFLQALMQTVGMSVYGIHMLTHWCRKIVVVGSGVAKPWHTRAHA